MRPITFQSGGFLDGAPAPALGAPRLVAADDAEEWPDIHSNDDDQPSEVIAEPNEDVFGWGTEAA